MFTKARLKLTAWYLGIIIFITISFTAAIFNLVIAEVDRLQLRHGPFFRPFEEDVLLETKKRVLNFFIVVDAVVIFTSGGLAYFLAGKTLKPIKQMVDDQNRFVSDASHEFKTPLTSLKTSFEVFLRDKEHTLKDADVLVKESVEEVDKLQRLAQSLLELARFGNEKVGFERINIARILEQSVKTISPLALKKKIKINKSIDDFMVMGSSPKLTQLFVIFLDNAVKYSKSAGQVNLIAKNGLVTVQDFGVGISADDQKHIFDRFYRADFSRTKIGKDGFGLGLSIAKKICDEHKLKVGVESQIGKGSVFTVAFQKVV